MVTVIAALFTYWVLKSLIKACRRDFGGKYGKYLSIICLAVIAIGTINTSLMEFTFLSSVTLLASEVVCLYLFFRHAAINSFLNRILLFSFASLLIWLLPTFVPFLYLVAATRWDLWTHHMKAVCRVLLMVAALCVVDNIHLPVSITELAVLLGSVAASHYSVAGIAKLRLEGRAKNWLENCRLGNLLAAAWVFGWRPFKRWVPVSLIVRLLNRFSRFLGTTVLLIELLPLFSFIDVKFTAASLISCAFLNVIIFICSGLCFWENVVILASISTLMLLEQDGIHFDFKTALLALVIQIGAYFGIPFGPTHLAWYDSARIQRISAAVRLGNQWYTLPSYMFRPHAREYSRNGGAEQVGLELDVFPLGGVESRAMLPRLRQHSTTLTPRPIAPIAYPSIDLLRNDLLRQIRHASRMRWLPDSHIYWYGPFPTASYLHVLEHEEIAWWFEEHIVDEQSGQIERLKLLCIWKSSKTV